MRSREFSLAILCVYLHYINGAILSENGGKFVRDKRYLVYPPPGTYAPSKVQVYEDPLKRYNRVRDFDQIAVLMTAVPSSSWRKFIRHLILGLGLPMEVDVSMIIGYVMKFNYVLPSNASYLTDPYVRYDRSINDHVEPDGNGTSPSNTKGTALISRWEYYEILESAFKSTRSGKACLLKIICETAAAPFTRSHTLTAQLAHVFLTPSTTSESYRNVFDQEYHAAEIAGQRDPTSCDGLFPECSESLLEYFTEVSE